MGTKGPRHGKATVGNRAGQKWNGERPPARADEIDQVIREYETGEEVDVVPPRPSRKKDTKRWCKGKVGREHVTEIRRRPVWSGEYRPCDWWAQLRIWLCYHQRVCVNCGKILVFSLERAECPDYNH